METVRYRVVEADGSPDLNRSATPSKAYEIWDEATNLYIYISNRITCMCRYVQMYKQQMYRCFKLRYLHLYKRHCHTSRSAVLPGKPVHTPRKSLRLLYPSQPIAVPKWVVAFCTAQILASPRVQERTPRLRPGGQGCEWLVLRTWTPFLFMLLKVKLPYKGL